MNNSYVIFNKELIPHLTGRTPLHIACMRNDQYAAEIIKLLLDHQANPNVICNVRRRPFL